MLVAIHNVLAEAALLLSALNCAVLRCRSSKARSLFLSRLLISLMAFPDLFRMCAFRAHSDILQRAHHHLLFSLCSLKARRSRSFLGVCYNGHFNVIGELSMAKSY